MSSVFLAMFLTLINEHLVIVTLLGLKFNDHLAFGFAGLCLNDVLVIALRAVLVGPLKFFINVLVERFFRFLHIMTVSMFFRARGSGCEMKPRVM